MSHKPAVLKKLEWSLRRRGVVGTLSYSATRPFRRTPPEWIRPENEQTEDEDFDRRYNVQTAGLVHLSDLETATANWVFGVDYEPSTAGDLEDMLAALDVQFEDYTFVDYGAGKGKALLLAGSHPFHRIIGVELAAELCEIARRNIQTYTGPRRAGSIEVVHEDATAFDIPDGPLVLYFYNPFDAEVMEAVITNIRQATAQTMRPVYILYRYARLAELFESWCATRCCTPSYTVFEA